MDNELALSGKTFLITGGTRGIGRGIVKALIAQGASVFAVYVRNQAKAGELEQALNTDKLRLVRADISREKGLATLTEAVAGIPLHGLVHCAATGVHKSLAQLTLTHFDWTMNLNVRAFFDLVLQLRQQFCAGASVIALSSQGAHQAIPHYTLVGASKAALEALCRNIAVEMSDVQVRCNILSPGSVLTEAWDVFPDKDARIAKAREKIPGGELISVEEVADVALFLLSDAARAINGQTIVVDRGERIVG